MEQSPDPSQSGGIPSQHDLYQCQRLCRQHLHVEEEIGRSSRMGWDLEAVGIERSEQMLKTRMIAQAMEGGLGWMHVDRVHLRSALLVCAFYAHLCCESVVDRRGMRG